LKLIVVYVSIVKIIAYAVNDFGVVCKHNLAYASLVLHFWRCEILESRQAY